MRLMCQRLSPRDMTLLEIARPAAGEDVAASEAEPAGVACTGSRPALCCALAACGSEDGCGPDAVAGTDSARGCVARSPVPASSTVTAAPCLDDVTVPSVNFAFKVSS